MMPWTSTLGFDRGDGGHERDDVRRAAHVALHLAHAGGGLDADAAGVEGDPLADEDELLFFAFAPLLGRVGMWTKRGSRDAALPDRDDELHPRFSSAGLVEDRAP